MRKILLATSAMLCLSGPALADPAAVSTIWSKGSCSCVFVRLTGSSTWYTLQKTNNMFSSVETELHISKGNNKPVELSTSGTDGNGFAIIDGVAWGPIN